MQSTTIRHQLNTIAKCGVQMHGSWLAINSLSINGDRTPEGYFSPGSQEGAGYA
jgi:hypothetical protein